MMEYIVIGKWMVYKGLSFIKLKNHIPKLNRAAGQGSKVLSYSFCLFNASILNSRCIE